MSASKLAIGVRSIQSDLFPISAEYHLHSMMHVIISSFQNGITPGNYEIADADLIQTYRFYAARARKIVDLIKEISKE